MTTNFALLTYVNHLTLFMLDPRKHVYWVYIYDTAKLRSCTRKVSVDQLVFCFCLKWLLSRPSSCCPFRWFRSHGLQVVWWTVTRSSGVQLLAVQCNLGCRPSTHGRRRGWSRTRTRPRWSYPSHVPLRDSLHGVRATGLCGIKHYWSRAVLLDLGNR